MGQSQLTKIAPQWVGIYVGHEDRLSAVGCGPAAAHVRANLGAVQRRRISAWKARCRTMPQVPPIFVEQQDRPKHSRLRVRFDDADQRGQCLLERPIVNGEFEHLGVSEAKLVVDDVVMQAHRFGAYRKRAVQSRLGGQLMCDLQPLHARLVQLTVDLGDQAIDAVLVPRLRPGYKHILRI